MGTTRTCSSCGDSISGTLDHCPKDGAPLFSDEVMSRVGMVLRDHEIQGVIGEGGMGVVYRAQHVVIEKPVAVKVLHDHFAKQKEMVDQFIIEAKAASRIRHPNIIDVTDFGTTPEGLVFLIMEYLDGESLQERLARVRRLSVFDAVNIVKQVARGLGAAHALGIVHRDLKPANIFLCQREGRRRIVRRMADETGPQFVIEPEDKYDFVKLLDFGVAKFMDLGPSAATRAGMLCGTPHYLSPEQAQEQSASERSDLYSLGAVFYEMVTGSVPYDGSSMFEILKGHVAGDLVPPSRRAPDAGIGPQVDAVIGRCLEKEPARRYASTDELCDALSDCVGECAFLRDAHRLPGIAQSGLDLTETTPSARKGGERSAPVENGFTAVEKESAWADLADIDDRPDGRRDERPGARRDDRPGRRKRAVDRRDTMRIPRRRAGRTALAVVGLLVVAGGVLWAFRGQLGLTHTAVVSVAAANRAPTPPAPGVPALATPPVPSPGPTANPTPAAEPAVAVAVAPKPVPSPAPVAPTPSPGVKVAATRAEVPALAAATPDKPGDPGADKSAQTRARASVGGARRASLPSPPMPVALPAPVATAPTPELPPPPAPAPSPAVAAVPAADVEALLREAQQAWSRRYYAVAIDKARLVLQAVPGRHDAYQIIAVCSCAVGSADDAREAVSHLDPHKQKLVQSLCKNHGVSLE